MTQAICTLKHRVHHFSRRTLFIILLLLICSLVVTAQNDFYTPLGLKPGTPAGSYPLGDVDTVSLFNGRVNVRIPLIDRMGRGGAGGQIATSVDSPARWQVYKSEDLNGNPIYGPGPSGSGNIDSQYNGHGEITVYAQGVGTGAANWCSEGLYSWGENTLTRFFWVEPDGTEHEMRDVLTGGKPLPSGGCWAVGPNRGRVFASTDGSGATFVTDDVVRDGIYVGMEYPYGFDWNGWLFLKDGTRIRISWVNGRGMRDRNGNLLTTNLGLPNPFILDPLRRTMGSGSGTPSECSALLPGHTTCSYNSYKGFGGAERRIYYFYDQSLGISHVRLPNGLTYRFHFNEWGDLIRLDLPTGGSIEYDYGPGLIGPEPAGQLPGGPPGVYGGGPNDMHIYRRLLERRVYREGHVLELRQTFSKPEDIYLNNAGFVEKKEYDGNNVLLRREKHYFHGSAERSFWLLPTEYPAWKDGLEYKTEIFDGNNNLLSKTERIWEQRAPVSWWTGSADTAPANDPRVAQETEFAEDGTYKITDYDYDPTVPYNSLTDIIEKQFNTYSTIRHTKTEYLKTLHGVDYTGSNIQNSTGMHMRDFPLRVSVYDSGGTERARTTYEYDNYVFDANHAPLVNRPGISGFDPAFSTSYITRGNVTGITKHLLNNGVVTGSVSAYSQYDIAGNVVKTIDGRGNSMTFNYADAFGAPGVEARNNTAPAELAAVNQSSFAFLTSVTNALGHTTYVQYDFYNNRPVDSEDPNGVLATGYFNDPLERPTQIIAANNPSSTLKTQTTFTYNDTGRTVTTTADQINFGDNVLKTETVFDGLGRTVETRQYETSSNFISVKHVPFTVLQDGSAWFVSTQTSNAFRPYLNEQPVWTTSYSDALGRVVKVKTPDNASVTSSYSGRATTVTDAAGKKRKSVVNEFGQIGEVYEDPQGANYLTSYAYSVLGKLVRVTQGSQQRFFMYDSLGRLIRMRNPEQATLGSLALSDSISGNSSWSMAYQYDANGNVTQKTDARGVVSTYAYDALDRNTTTDYSDTALNPDIKRFYDGATNGKGRFWHHYTNGDFSAGSNVEHASVDSYDVLGRTLVRRQLFKVNGVWGPTYQTSRTYDRSGAITSQTYPSGRTVNYLYDLAGRTASFAGNLGDGVTRTYASSFNYNANNQVTRELFGTQTPLYHKLQYNIRGQLWDIRVATGSDVNGSWNRGCLQFFYESTHTHGASGPDNNGNVLKTNHYVPFDETSSTWAIHDQFYTYDALNRMASVSEFFISSTQPYTAQSVQKFTYDRWGNRTINTGETWGTGVNNRAFTVDPGNTNRLLVPVGQSGVMSYDAAGNLTTDTYTGAGARTYDAENRMSTTADYTGQTSRYTYDADGRRTRRQVASSLEYWYVYGLDGELLAEYRAGTAPSAAEKEFGYRNGQLLVTATGRFNVAAAASGAVASASSAHTCCGFSTTGAINGNNRGPWGQGEGWNDATESQLPDWIQVDFAGSKTIDEINVFSLHDAYTQENTPTETQTFTLYGLIAFNVQYWNGSTWVTIPNGTVTGNNKVWRKFTFSPITTSKIRVFINTVPDAWSRVVEIQAFGTSAGGEKVQWLVADHLGTPRIILDQTGSLAGVKRHDYLPFGEELYAGAGGRTQAMGYRPDAIRQQFTGYERDSETGLDYAQARYYSSVQGRFTSPDPLIESGVTVDAQSWNRYAYARNNPLLYTDPSGLLWYRNNEDGTVKWFDDDPGEGWKQFTEYVYWAGEENGYVVLDPHRNFWQAGFEKKEDAEAFFSDVDHAETMFNDPPSDVSLLDGIIEVSDYVGGFGAGTVIRKFGRYAIRKVARESTESAARFVTGQLLERTVQTSKGPIGVLAEVIVEGQRLTLKDLTVYAIGQEQLKGGYADLIRALGVLRNEARDQGFTEIRVIAERVATSSSKNPGRSIDIVIPVKPKQ